MYFRALLTSHLQPPITGVVSSTKILQNLLRLKLRNSLEIIDSEEINLGLLNQENVAYLAYFVSYFIQRNDIKSLDIIFKYFVKS